MTAAGPLASRLKASRFYAPLNPEQRAAADDDRQLIVVSAGAGTGKTQTLVARYLRLLLGRVDHEGLRTPRPFDHLLAITYTNAAAAEMRQRIDQALRELGLVSLARQMDGAWISTFHGFCERVLKRFAFDLGVDPAFTVLDEDRSMLLRRQSYEEALVGFYRADPAALLRLLDAYSPWQLRRDCFALAAECAKTGLCIGDLQPESFGPDCPSACPDLSLAHSLRDFAAVWQRRYTALKQQQGSYDFADLLLKCDEAFRSERIRSHYRAQFAEVVLDEAQDTNDLQLSLLERIARRRFIVGDFKQSIYRFQGANVGVFTRLVESAQDPADPTSCALALTRNYRSRGEILEAVNGLFSTSALMGEQLESLVAGSESQRAPAEPGAPAPVQITGIAGKSAAAGEKGAPEAPGIAALEPKPDYHARNRLVARQEAAWIAGRVSALIGRYQPGDIVVLVSKRRFGRAIARALAACGLLARIVGGDDFLTQPVIRDARVLLAALRNPADDAAFVQLLLSSLGRVSDQGLYELAQAARAADRTLWGAAQATQATQAAQPSQSEPLAFSDPEDAENLRQVCALLQESFSCLGAVPLSGIIARAFDQRAALDYLADANADPDLDAGADTAQNHADLQHLCRIADEVQAGGGSLIDLIVWLDEKESTGANVEAPPATTDAAGVLRIMTIHAAKGLQFPVVAVASAQDIATPQTPAEGVFVLSDESGSRLGLKYKTTGPDGKEHTYCTPSAERAVAQGKEAEAFEKVRQLYVACTRAEQVLLLSYRSAGDKGVTAQLAQAVREAEER